MESYPRARLHGMRWILVEASDRVLPEIDASLADYAVRQLRARGIEIRLGTPTGAGEATGHLQENATVELVWPLLSRADDATRDAHPAATLRRDSPGTLRSPVAVCRRRPRCARCSRPSPHRR